MRSFNPTRSDMRLGAVLSLALCLGLASQTLGGIANAADKCAPEAAPVGVMAPGHSGVDLSQMPGYSLAAQGITPAIKGRVVNASVIANETQGFRERVINSVVERTAPMPGMTRAAVEASWGSSLTSNFAPGKPVSIYVNNRELVDGFMVQRNISKKNLKVYEVVYTDSQNPAPDADAKVVSVKPIIVPMVGYHKNLYTLLLTPDQEIPLYGFTVVNSNNNKAYYAIPQERISEYRKFIDSPFDLIRVHTDDKGVVIAQEFVDGIRGGQYLGTYTFSSAQRFTGK